jgi:hypothetical protein
MPWNFTFSCSTHSFWYVPYLFSFLFFLSLCYFFGLNLIETCLIQYIYLIGLRWDRQWVVVNSKGRACTQRVEPKLALVEVELPPEAFDEHWEPTTDSFMGILHFSYYIYHAFYLFIYFIHCHSCFSFYFNKIVCVTVSS